MRRPLLPKHEPRPARRLRAPGHVAIVLAFGLTSCGGQPSPSATPLPPPQATADPCSAEQAWSAQLTVSGGFAGIHQTIALDAGGALTTTDAQSGSSQTRLLASDEIQRLRSLLAEACPFPDPGRLPPCADCFGYQLEITYRSGIALAELNDVSLGGSAYETVIREFIDLGGQG